MNNYEHLKNDKNFSIVDFEHADFILGQTGEATTLAKIRQLFPNVNKYTDFWSPFDYYNKNDNGEVDMIFEVKTRRCSKTQYPTLAFGKTKLDFAKDEMIKSPNLRVIICWLLNDENLYFWEYTGDNSKDFHIGSIANIKRNQKHSPSVMVYTDKIKLLNHHNILSA
tara:strand:+ start:223 stop:723 length:501 start_codon:yes stop_codon:yes gene_type:complete